MSLYEQGRVLIWVPGVPGVDGMRVTVTGMSHTGMAVLGAGYIVLMSDPQPHYPYTHCVAFECHLREIEL